MTEASEKMLKRMRCQVFENIMCQPIGWFDLETSSPGVLVNRLARNIPLIKAVSIVCLMYNAEFYNPQHSKIYDKKYSDTRMLLVIKITKLLQCADKYYSLRTSLVLFLF